MSGTDILVARAQIALAFFYGLIFVGIFIVMALFWETLGKVEIGLLTMMATGAMQQSKDAGNYFFARMRGNTPPDPTAPGTEIESTTTVKQKTPPVDDTPALSQPDGASK